MSTNAAPDQLGLVRYILKVQTAATNYINQFLQEHKFPELEHLAEEHVEGEIFSKLFENISIWFSRTRFQNHQNTLLVKNNTSIEWTNSLSTNPQHTNYLLKSRTTGHQIWKVSSRKPVSAAGLKTHIF